MHNLDENISVSSSHVDHIPLIWITPDRQQQSTRLAIWLPGGMGKKEDTLPCLQQLVRAGFVAISFDPWQHGGVNPDYQGLFLCRNPCSA